MRVDDLNVGDNAAAAHQAEFAQLLTDREAAGCVRLCIPARSTVRKLCAERAGGKLLVNHKCRKVRYGRFLKMGLRRMGGDPLTMQRTMPLSRGDCFLIYPAEKDAADRTCKSSVRLERMAEGVRDVNKLLIIEKEAPQLAGED